MFTIAREPIIQEIKVGLEPYKVRLFIKREDLIHPVISGNKWRKLKYNLLEAKSAGCQTLLTFGGAYSNHIHATAGAARQFGFKSIGIIRGEEHLPLNPTLKEASAMGMELYYMDRGTYREKHTAAVLDDLRDLFGEFYLVPEGGTNQLALKGTAEIVEDIQADYDYFIASCGTGGTLAGIIAGLNGKGSALGFAVLKGDFLAAEISQLLTKNDSVVPNNWSVNNDYHFDGYAKYNMQLVSFINKFSQQNKIPLDPIYTGKMMYGIIDLIKQEYFPQNARILAIHTGGLQGVKGFNKRFGNLIKV